jgi:hypothetical protein
MLLSITEFIKLVRNEMPHVQRTTHYALILPCKLTARSKSHYPCQYKKMLYINCAQSKCHFSVSSSCLHLLAAVTDNTRTYKVYSILIQICAVLAVLPI